MVSRKPVSKPRKSVTPRTTRARRKPAASKREVARRPLGEALQKARASSREMLLAGIGAVAAAKEAQQERRAEFEERKASLIAAGRKLEPRVNKAIERARARVEKIGAADATRIRKAVAALRRRIADAMQKRAELAKTMRADRRKIGRRIDSGMNRMWAGLGLTTRADLDRLNQKLDKLIALQRV